MCSLNYLVITQISKNYSVILVSYTLYFTFIFTPSLYRDNHNLFIIASGISHTGIVFSLHFARMPVLNTWVFWCQNLQVSQLSHPASSVFFFFYWVVTLECCSSWILVYAVLFGWSFELFTGVLVMSGLQWCQKAKSWPLLSLKAQSWIARVGLYGGWSEQVHSLPTVFSGNDYKAAVSASEIKRMYWHPYPPKKIKSVSSLPFSPHFLSSLLPSFLALSQIHTLIVQAGLDFGNISQQKDFG